jgi:uncharacterized protein
MADSSRLSPSLAVLSAVTARRWKLGPARNKAGVERGVAVRMRDGAVLLADHYSPVGSGPRPTVMMRGPYGRGLLHAMAALPYAERGYHVLLQSCRGTFGSGGTFRPYADEAADGQDTVGWLRDQDWFDGRLATVGGSYLAYVQWALALDPPPELKAMVVQVSPHDLGTSCFGHGPFELHGRLAWSELMAHQEQRGPARQIWRMLRTNERLGPMLSRLPLTATGAAIGGARAPWYAEWLAHPDLADPYWDDRRATAALGRVTVPTLLISGFYDQFAEQTMHQYQALRRRGIEAALTIGPWAHTDVDSGMVTRETLAWLDAFAAGDGPTPRPQPVRAWVGGSGQWHELPQWPPAGTAERTWYLYGGGILADTAPAAGEAATGFLYDPLDPTPSVGGRILSFSGRNRDNAAVEARDDVLTFSTAPLAAPVHVAGVPSVRLYVSYDGACADIFARLCDVDERARSHDLTDQIIRLGPAGLAAGGARGISLALTDVSHVFQPGHRIRLQVSGGAFPRYARNLGTAADPITGTQTAPVSYRVFHSGAQPSAITMPVLPSGGGTGGR